MQEIVDDLILLNYLDAGCFSEIFLSKKQGLNEILATKKISLNNMYQEPCFKNFLQNEINFLLEINHPNIIKLYDVKTKNDYIYLVMEYCNGGTLSSALEKNKEKFGKPFSEKTVQFLMKQILSGVECLHSHGIIHSDLKLDNILLKYESKDCNILSSQIKIIDFNISTRSREYINNSNNFMNKRQEIIPMMVNDDFGDDIYDKKVDIWALGVLCFELLFGYEPYESKDDTPINKQDIIIIIPQSVSLEAQTFLLSMLQKNGNKRLSAFELLNHPFLSKKFETIQIKKKISKTPYTASKKFIRLFSPQNSVRKSFRPVGIKPISLLNTFSENSNEQSEVKGVPEFGRQSERNITSLTESKSIKKFISKFDNNNNNNIQTSPNDNQTDQLQNQLLLQPKTVPIVIPKIGIGPQPIFKLYSIGSNINVNQLKIIIICCKYYYMLLKGAISTAQNSAEKICQTIGGDWMVFISKITSKNYDFFLSLSNKNDFTIFSLNDKLFNICKYN